MTRNDRIMRLHKAGATYGQIVSAMKRDFPGLTRNAVAGVVCRNRTDKLPELSVAELARRGGFNWAKANLIAEFS